MLQCQYLRPDFVFFPRESERIYKILLHLSRRAVGIHQADFCVEGFVERTVRFEDASNSFHFLIIIYECQRRRSTAIQSVSDVSK